MWRGKNDAARAGWLEHGEQEKCLEAKSVIVHGENGIAKMHRYIRIVLLCQGEGFARGVIREPVSECTAAIVLSN